MSTFTALATKAYKDPITTVWAGSIKTNCDYLIRGVAQAWCVFDGTTATITSLNAFNVSNITDNGTGRYSITFTTGFQTQHVVPFGMSYVSGVGSRITLEQSGTHPLATGSKVNVEVINEAAADIDADKVFIAVIGTGL